MTKPCTSKFAVVQNYKSNSYKISIGWTSLQTAMQNFVSTKSDLLAKKKKKKKNEKKSFSPKFEIQGFIILVTKCL